MKNTKPRIARATTVTPTPIPAFAPPDNPDEGEVVGIGLVLDVDEEVGDEEVLLEDGLSVDCQLICIRGARSVYDGMASPDIVSGIATSVTGPLVPADSHVPTWKLVEVAICMQVCA
jgi:hypothetical protein